MGTDSTPEKIPVKIIVLLQMAAAICLGLVGKAHGPKNLFLARLGATGSLSPPFPAQVVELVDTQVSEACA
jgi:hypothetical protein